MGCEQQVAEKLVQKFSFLEGKIKVTRERRLFVDVNEQKNIRDVLEYFFHELKFTQLCTITGLDEGEKFCMIYHVAHDDGTLANVKMWTPREDPRIQTMLPIYTGGVFYERELVDLFGIIVEGLPEGDHYPLPEDWPEGQYPLRKDWKPEMLKKKEA